jgi:glucan phosphoethanolaminetransferase (alkaline phosphatase superfamily)
MEESTEPPVQPQEGPSPPRYKWLDILWFVLHMAAVYAMVNFCTVPLAAWTAGTLLPLLQHPTSSGSFQFLYSHILAFSFTPAFLAGLTNARFKHKVAQFVWFVPAVILAYKFVTFPAPSVWQSQFSGAFHQYFAGAFSIREFRNWDDFWSIVRSNPDMMRGLAQQTFTAPFYAGVGYSVAAWIGRRSDLNRKVAEKVKRWERSRFERHA